MAENGSWPPRDTITFYKREGGWYWRRESQSGKPRAVSVCGAETQADVERNALKVNSPPFVMVTEIPQPNPRFATGGYVSPSPSFDGATIPQPLRSMGEDPR